MLPDYPKLKEKIQNLLIARMKKVQSASMGPLAGMPTYRVFEGNKSVWIREDGTKEVLEQKRAEAKIEINVKEYEEITPLEILNRIDIAAQELAIQRMKVALKKIDKAVEQTGNIVDTKGRPFSIEDYFKMIGAIWIDFDEKGKPILPSFLGEEKAKKSIIEVLLQLKSDAKCKKRFDELIEKKKEDWRDRESNRKLVG